MKVSIIIPYDNEKIYIDDCIGSLQDQICQDFEAVVVCSRTGNEGDFEQWKEKASFPLTVLTLTDRDGVAAARNTGVSHSRGEYILFLDIDDYLEKSALEELLKLAGDGADLVHAEHWETWYGKKIFYKNGRDLDRQNSDRSEEQWAAELDLTVHGYMLRKEFILQQGLSFDESFHYCTDLPYVARILGCGIPCVRTSEPFYVQRKHNDPVHMPSLSQTTDKKGKCLELLRAYRRMKEYLSGEDELMADSKLISCYIHSIAPWYKTAGSDVDEVHHEAVKCLGLLSEEAVSSAGSYVRRILRYAGRHSGHQVSARLSRRDEIRMLAKALTSRAACKLYLYRRLFTRMRIKKNRVVFESFLGKGYSDSPKYIFEYLNQNMPGKYQCIWILNKEEKLPYPAKCIRRYSFRYFYYIATAKYFVFNGRQSRDHIKREGSVFLETWHGTPLKKLVFDMHDVTASAPLYKRDVYLQSRDWDYLLAPNDFSSQIFRRCFRYEGEMLETGYPRNDILYLEEREKKSRAEKIREKIGLPNCKKVILYAPTWRDDEFYSAGKHRFDLKLDLGKMHSELGEEYIFLIRTHYFVSDRMERNQYEGFVYNVSDYDDIAELYLIADILITDYSSVFFDYANLRRPMLFFTYDLEKYRDILRGFYIDLEEELPGPMLFSTDEIIDAIRDLPQIRAEYREKYRLFCEKYCGWEDGNASQRVVEAVFGQR